MPNMTFSLPDDLHKEMRAHPQIKWSEVAREAIRKEIERQHLHDKMLEGSKLTEEDAVDLGRRIRRNAARA